MAPSALDPEPIVEKSSTPAPPQLARFDANSPTTTADALVEVLNRDGGVIVENLFTPELAAQIKSELKPHFDTDRIDKTGFFPETTQRASGLIGISPGCVEYLTTPILIEVINKVLSSTYSFWVGEKLRTVTSKPQISSTAAFRVNPGGRQQALHRDDADYHARNVDFPVLLGCVAAITKTTKENGATVVIPGSHTWGPERMPEEEEAIPAELDVGGALIFFGNTYHAGGRNTTVDEARETVGLFFTKGFYRQAENQYLMVPVEKAREMSTQVKRLLGYGISPPGVGFYEYQDPMRVLYGVEDEETVEL
jgi:ectoine hydroxylase-related dioxygenase (phytanoyl-CoA dioxygenase family)